MEIEKEVPPNYFRNNQHKALVNVLFTSSWITDKMKQLLEGYDLTPQQYNILRILHRSETPLSTLQIRERMLDKMSDTSRIVERLLKKELVNKEISRLDKRLVDVTISPKGVELLDQLEAKSTHIDSFSANLSELELNSLNILLDKMREASGLQ